MLWLLFVLQALLQSDRALSRRDRALLQTAAFTLAANWAPSSHMGCKVTSMTHIGLCDLITMASRHSRSTASFPRSLWVMSHTHECMMSHTHEWIMQHTHERVMASRPSRSTASSPRSLQIYWQIHSTSIWCWFHFVCMFILFVFSWSMYFDVYEYGVATVSRIDQILGLFCRILSLW